MKLEIQSIGIVHSPFVTAKGTPAQPAADEGTRGYIEVYPEFAEGLKDLDLFSHIHVLFHLHLASKKELTVIPFLDSKPHGVFATRSPGRPNSLGLSVVEVERVEGNIVHVRNLDILDGSPVFDIKPYVAQFDIFNNTRNGWFGTNIDRMREIKDDGRFTDKSLTYN